MGNSIIKNSASVIPPLLQETQIFALWTINDVRELLKRFQNQIHGFAIVEAQFESIIAFKENVSKHVELDILFDILDNDHDGRIDGLELLGGIALCCHAPFEEKARFCFELFDFNLNSLLSKKELVMMMMSSVCGMNLLTGGGEELEPELEIFEALAEDAMFRADMNADGQISYEEFVFWARSNRDLMAGLECLNRISLEAKLDVQSDDSAPETESDGDDSNYDAEVDLKFRFNRKFKGDESLAIIPWKGQIHEPTNYIKSKGTENGPETNLELSWVFGFKGKGSTNNVRYLLHSSGDRLIIYPSASVCIIYDPKEKKQNFYLGHNSEVTSISLHPNEQIAASADKNSNIHIWTLDKSKNAISLLIFSTIGNQGIQQISFSPSGERIASVGNDPDHTICIHDVNNGDIISSAKGIANPNLVFDIAFSNNGSEIAMVGKNQIKFFLGANSNKRALENKLGKIGHEGKRQSFFCVVYMKNEAFIGCASGEIYRFKDAQCISIIQAHGVKEPIICMYFNKTDGTLLTGGKDSLVKTWDHSLKEIGTPIDLSEDLDGDGKSDTGIMNGSISSIHQVDNKILVGTFGCDIFEAILPQNPSQHPELNRVAWGHSSGELWGLSVHPTRDEFATTGDDKTIRIWSIRSHEQINFRKMPDASRAVSYNQTGDILCVGMIGGNVALMEASNPQLRVYSTWKHTDKSILDIKFSPDGYILALASQDSNIYLYASDDKKNFHRHSICRGHSSSVNHIDFSSNSQYLQSNGADYNLLFWDISGNQIKQSSSMRDIIWATSTCVFGWALQGIWKKNQDFSDINSCMALSDIGDIVTGDDFGKVNLFKYPALKDDAIHQSYVGHSSHVTNVKFSWDRRFLISIGGNDKSILLWRHIIEQDESDVEKNDPGGDSVISSDGEYSETSFRKDHPEIKPRSLEQEAANLGWSVSELKEYLSKTTKNFQNSLDISKGDESFLVPQWKSCIVEPSRWSSSQSSTDVDLNLFWVHGHRCHDCRNNVHYSAEGSIVYNAANIAVVYHKPSGKQNFLIGSHNDEVIGIGIHPAGQIFATGDAGRKSTVVVWNSKDMTVLTTLENVHDQGTPLLCFNSSGNILATIGLESNNTLCIHDWAKSFLILKTPTSKKRVLCCSFLVNDQRSEFCINNCNNDSSVHISFGRDILVTGGQSNLKFWWWQGQNIQSQNAIWGDDIKEKKSTILCIASANSDICLTGSSEGSLLIWKKFKLVSNVKRLMENISNSPNDIGSGNNNTVSKSSSYPHKSSILSMHAIQGNIDIVSDESEYMIGYSKCSRYITGDRDGVICIWRMVESHSGNLLLILMKKFNIAEFLPSTNGLMIKSISERDGVLLIGNNASEIFEINEEQISFVFQNKKLIGNIVANRVGSGHSNGEVWGLCTHPFLPIFFTTGDDNVLKCWSLKSNKLLSYALLPDKSRAIGIQFGESNELAVALNQGSILILKVEVFLNPENKSSFKKSIDPSLDGVDISRFLDISKYSAEIIENSPMSDFGKGNNASVGTFGSLLLKGPKKWVQVVKYSFDSSLLAAGSHDNNIYVYDCKSNYSLLYTFKDHSSSITHIDFGISLKVEIIQGEPKITISSDGSQSSSSSIFTTEYYSIEKQQICVKKFEKSTNFTTKITTESPISEEMRSLSIEDIIVQSTSSNGELLYWKSDGSRILSNNLVKDAFWSTFTSPYGWSVQGIWSKDMDPSDIIAVGRSHSYELVPVIASVDTYGKLKLFNYPCVFPGAPDKCYRGHSNKITNVDFSFDDMYCITTGGSDHCVFVWATDIQDEIRERKVFFSSNSIIQPEVDDFKIESDSEENINFNKIIPLKGDEFSAIKPWKSAIREPSDFKESSDLIQERPSLELKYVHGYRGWDCRNNIGFADSKFEIVYHIAGIGVVLNTQDHKQILNTEHDDDILCLSVHPEGHTIATGEIGKFPKIVLWDANTGVTIRIIKFHKKGVSQIAFSYDGQMLISCGMDEDRTIAVHNTRTGTLLGKGKVGKGIEIYSVAVSSNNYFITGGKNHIKFWEFPKPTLAGGELSSKSGIYNLKSVKARTVCSCAYLGVDAITGMNDGSIVLWKERSNTKAVQGHNGPVSAMISLANSGGRTIDGRESGPRVISGGKDGVIQMWDIQLNKIWSLDLTSTTPTSACPQIQALSTRDSRLLIGTKGAEIYEVSLLGSSEACRHVQGHFSERAEVWGLSPHPSLLRFATCGDDSTVRLWDAKLYIQIHVITLDVKCRALSFHPDGSQIAVARLDGKVSILSDDLSRIIETVTVSSSWSQIIVFSPDGQLLAIGSHDSTIYILETKSYSCLAKCKGHHSFISGIDFSIDSTKLQTTSGDYELLFWDAYSGKQIVSPTEVRDVKWHTHNCIFGWAVQGIWSSNMDGTDINCVAKSQNNKYLATGDDNKRIKLFNYPCYKENSDFKEYKGHSEHVMNVKFSHDSKYLYSVGGLDKAILQFEVKV